MQPAPHAPNAAAARPPVEQAVRAWLPKVLGWCARLGGPTVSEEDAAQDVMIVLVRRYDEIGDSSTLGPWMYGVTRRVLADHRRRAFIRRWLPGVLFEPVDVAPRPDERAMRSQATQQVQAILDAMPLAQREAFVLADIEGYTDVEVAGLVGAPTGTVKSRLRLARARFREAADRLSDVAPPEDRAADAIPCQTPSSPSRGAPVGDP